MQKYPAADSFSEVPENKVSSSTTNNWHTRLRLPLSRSPRPPSPTENANLDWCALGCVPVDALAAGDSAFGCRQMIGNVWEWTASDFQPYPGFVTGPYKEYSEPWFGNHKVLRGGCWATRSRLIHNGY